MKKVLVLLSIVGVAQGYEHLKQLPETSRIRKMCHPVVYCPLTRKNECDDLENLLKRHQIFVDLRKNIDSEEKEQEIRAFQDRVWSRCDDILYTKSKMNNKLERQNECEAMANLAGKLCKERFDEFEAAILADQK